MKKYIMTFDQGTTSSRCVLYDKKGEAVSIGQKEIKQIYPNPGWVEHDPTEIWSSQMGVASEAMAKIGINHKNISGIGITNQRETTIVWNKETGLPIYNAIVWQCRRTAEYCDELNKDENFVKQVKEKTGLIIDAYFSGTKIKWILDNVEGAREAANKGELIFGTVDSWLIWNLTGGKIHVTDYSNASRTMLFNINTLEWDDEILEKLDIPKSMLPDVKPSSYIYGETIQDFFGAPIKISGAAGDQQAALFGQTCFEKNQGKNTYGTGCFLLLNTGEKPIISNNGLLSTIAWGIDGKVNYALEGSVFVAGAAIQWLRDEMGLIKDAPSSHEVAMSVEDTNGVVVVPAFVGVGAPYWNPNTRGAILGLTRGCNNSHVVRATVESLAFQSYDLIKSMEDDTKEKITILNVDGGASGNDFLMQFQSDILDVTVRRPKSVETTSLGAAFLAGLATGFWDSKSEIKKLSKDHKLFKPSMEEKEREYKLALWEKAINCVLHWGE